MEKTWEISNQILELHCTIYNNDKKFNHNNNFNWVLAMIVKWI